MGRQTKKQEIPAMELLNFHFSTPATTTELPMPASRTENFHRRVSNNSNSNRRLKSQHYRSAQDRTAARRRANSSNFYLHSSPEHSFALTRLSNSKIHGGDVYTFSGCDSPVSWESVRIVKHSIPIDHRNPEEDVSCPICLCDFTCPRVTKCGHSFCLSCILHHVETNTASSPRGEVKCPCCSIPLSMDDLRPVIIQRTIPPRIQNFIRLQKLHRQKGCCAPYLALPQEPMHSNPHSAPCQSDVDAPFSRFNYVDPSLYQSLLEENRLSLLQERKSTSSETLDYTFLTMALEIVSGQQQSAKDETHEEIVLQERFAKETSGIYQRQSPALIYHPKQSHDNAQNSPSNRSTDSKAAEEGNPKPNRATPSTMYLNDADAVPFYQAEDGQLVFLIGFNMVCLCADFSKTRPVEGMQDQPPLPDYLSGRILEIQNVHLTPDIRKRMPFLEHIPLYTDISFVELDLSSILSNETKKKFRADLEKRKKKRQSKVKAEKKADREARVEEARLITDRKARLTLIDPSDEFFQPTLSAEQETFITQDVEETHFEMGNHDSSVQVPCEIIASQPFLAACKRSVNPLRLESKEFFPGLQGGVDAFPALGGSSTKMPSKQKHALIPETPIGLATKDVGKKKGEKGKKVVLFSTSGQRGYNF